jgi:hypothetical protein
MAGAAWRLRALAVLSGAALITILSLLLPPAYYRLADAYIAGSGGAAQGVTLAELSELPKEPKDDPEWALWRPFTLKLEELNQEQPLPQRLAAPEAAPAPAAGAEAAAAAAVRDTPAVRDRRRGGAWPAGVTAEAGEQAAAVISPDVFAELPAAFLPEFKAPCWRRNATGALACLPYFYTLGVFQCGVKDIFRRLLHHPDAVKTHNDSPHFWDEVRSRVHACARARMACVRARAA